MFLGTHTPRIDEKGRFFLPAKFREDLADGLVITRAQDRCLAIYPLATFEEMTRNVRNASISVMQNRNFQRMLAAAASEEVPDKQGRVTVPPKLREYAGLQHDIAVVGAMNRVEVWDVPTWEAYTAEQEAAFAEMNEELFPG